MALKRESFRIATVIAVSLALAAPAVAFATDLGHALNFAALSTGNNVIIGNGAGVADLAIGGKAATIQKGAGVGEVVTNPGKIILGPGAGADSCITAGAVVKVGKNADCSTIDTSGSNPELTTLSDAIADTATFVNAASSQPATALPAVKVAKNGNQTITDTVSGGLNVFSIPSINIANGGTLEVSGGASDHALLLVAGNVKVGPDAVIDTTGGLPRTSLLILSSGRSVTVGHDGVLDATVVAPNANCILGPNAATEGAYICGKHVSVNHDAGLLGEASTVSVP
jgi:hypothetical protein